MNNETRTTFPWVFFLTILFIGLKLTGHITWSWLWVLSPIWIPFSVVLFVVLLIVVPMLFYR
ncbi:MAG: hypothetical protein ACOC80_16560 [Petrotogales bacterium]